MKQSLLDRLESLSSKAKAEPIDIYFSTIDEQGKKGEPEYYMTVHHGKACSKIPTKTKIILPL